MHSFHIIRMTCNDKNHQNCKQRLPFQSHRIPFSTTLLSSPFPWTLEMHNRRGRNPQTVFQNVPLLQVLFVRKITAHGKCRWGKRVGSDRPGIRTELSLLTNAVEHVTEESEWRVRGWGRGNGHLREVSACMWTRVCVGACVRVP